MPSDVPPSDGDARPSDEAITRLEQGISIPVDDFVDESRPPQEFPDLPPAEDVPDVRLYLPLHDGWEARIKNDTERVYCYSKNPDEDYFHLIITGEIYLQHDNEKYCLRCAFRNGTTTFNRLFWQNRGRRKAE